MRERAVRLNHGLSFANAVVGRDDHRDLRSHPDRLVYIGFAIVALLLRIVERERRDGGAQHVHRQRVAGSVAQQGDDRRVQLALFRQPLVQFAQARGAWAAFRTTTGSRFLQNSSGGLVRGCRCRDRPERRDLHRCSKSWMLVATTPSSPLGAWLWSRWALVSRFDRRIWCCGPRAKGRGECNLFLYLNLAQVSKPLVTPRRNPAKIAPEAEFRRRSIRANSALRLCHCLCRKRILEGFLRDSAAYCILVIFLLEEPPE